MTRKATHFRDDILSKPIENFKDHYVLVFDVISIKDATKSCHYPELVGEPLRLELNFTDPLERDTELIVLGERKSSVAVDKFGVAEKIFKKDNVSLQKKSSVSSFSSIGTLVFLHLTMFQFFPMRPLPL